MRHSPTTTLFAPVEGLILHFLGIASSGKWWNCAPGFMFVRAILTGPRRGGRSGLTVELRTLVRPMTGFSALVAIALLRWSFGPGCLGLDQRKYLGSGDTCGGSCDIAKHRRRSSDIRCMTRWRPFLSVKLRTVRIFSLATNIVEHQFLGDHVSMGA